MRNNLDKIIMALNVMSNNRHLVEKKAAATATENTLLKVNVANLRRNQSQNLLKPTQATKLTEVHSLATQQQRDPSPLATDRSHDDYPKLREPRHPSRTAVVPRSPPPTRYATVLKLKNLASPSKAMQLLRKEIDLDKVGGAFKAATKLRNGDVILESHSEEQRESLQKFLEGKEATLEAQKIENSDPKVLITGVESWHELEDLKETLAKQNPQITIPYGGTNEVVQDLRFVAKRRCRNPQRNNWVFQVPPALYKLLMKTGEVIIDFIKVRVERELDITRCFKCNRFGHVAKHCRETGETCPRCGKQHKVRECESAMFDCVNCLRAGLTDRRHAASDKACPVLIRRSRLAESRTNYG